MTIIRILSLCCAGSAVAASGALAGGYVAPVAPVTDVAIIPAPVAPPVADWSGAYVGGSLGYVFGSDDRVGVSDPADNLIAAPGSVDLSGATIGLHGGYRWQRAMGGRQIVFGPELSVQTSKVDDEFDNGSFAARSEMKQLVALRFKTGVLNAAGNTLFYGQLGAARGDFDYKVQGAGMDYDDGFKANALMAGLGVERKVTDRWSIFGEYEYRGFDKKKVTDANGFTSEATPEHHSVKLGVNFSF